jgi:cytochrome b561
MTEVLESAEGEAKAASPASKRFDRTSIALHWLTVFLIASQFSTAWLREAVDKDSSAAIILLTLHENSGVLIWIIGMIRLIWRHNYAYLPPYPDHMPKIQRTIATLNEYGLYTMLILQPITGLGRVLLRGKPFDLFFWKVPALVEPNETVHRLVAEAHELGARALALLIGLHAGAALFHYFILRDGVLQRMLPWASSLVRASRAETQLSAEDAE